MLHEFKGGADQVLVNGEHRRRVVELAAVVRRREDGHEPPVRGIDRSSNISDSSSDFTKHAQHCNANPEPDANAVDEP